MMKGDVSWITKSRAPMVVGAAAGVLAWVGLAAGVVSVWAEGPQPVLGNSIVVAQAQVTKEVVIFVSDLPKSGLSEFEFWKDPASPGGQLIGTPNNGDNLDPPPESEPHVTF